ncbi:lipopolysaccharide assembly protein LapB [Pseudaeromonas sharmana]|uniref:Lipopolysaccharide assembly protein B n=1 Tax=Pseudaeromonas sharmana TaxID=328412 RepID=A0ABV8CPH9_9GAMM
MLELLFLLLPIAAAYGWYMGQRGVRLDNQQSSHKLSRNYVAGINFLLSDQPDKAVDLFIELLQVDEETLETHMALGNLFRQRGEVDRAIRIHQNLVARPSLTFEQRDWAMLELARDFVAAGLLDRAEEILVELVRHDEHEIEAAELLINLYQQLRDWERAIEVAQRNSKKLGEKIQMPLAQFHCELAEMDLQSGQERKAITRLRKALQIRPDCVRASLRLAEIYLQQNDISSAVVVLAPLGQQSPDMVSEALPLLARCFSNPDERYTSILRQWLDASGSASVALALSDLMTAQGQSAEAESFVLRELKRHPTMKSFAKLMDYRLSELDNPRAVESIGLLKQLVEEQIRAKPRYCCTHCGFTSRLIFWQCPSCKQWATIKPIRGLDGE